MVKHKPHERDKYVTEEEFKLLLRAASYVDDNRRAVMMIYLAGKLGLRIGELIRLKRGCFGRLDENIVLVETLKIKGRPIKAVAVTDKVRDVIGDYVEKVYGERDKRAGRPTQGWLFRGKQSKKHLIRRQVTRIFKEMVHRAGLNPRYSFHCLRHYFGMKCWAKSKDLKFVQQQLRHQDMSTSEIYVHMDERARVDQARRM